MDMVSAPIELRTERTSGHGTVQERQSRALVLMALVLSCGSLLGPVALLHAATDYSFSGPKAEDPCPDCRTRAEQLRRAAGVLAERATYQDLNEAVEQLQESARLFQQDHSPRDAAENYIKIGEIYRISGRYRQELSMYDQALALAGESEIALRCSILNHQAIAYLDSEIEQSRNLSKKAFDLSERTPDPSAKAEALQAFGVVVMATKLEKGLELMRSAIQFFHQAKDVDGEAQSRLFEGSALFHRDNALDEAGAAFEEALRLWTSVNHTYGMALAHGALGLYWDSKGEPQKAMKEYDWAGPVFHAVHDRKNEAIILRGRGDISAEVGNYEASLRYYQKAYAVFLQIHDVRGEMAALEGTSHAEWVLYRSRRLNDIKLRRARQLHFSRYEASALAGIADFYVFHGDFIEAEPLYQKALDLFRAEAEPIQVAKILIRLGQLYSKQAQDEQALAAFREALDIAEKKDQFAQAAAAHFEIATIDQRRGRLGDARDEVEKALAIIESQRIKISDFDERASYFASVHEYYQLYIDALMQLDRRNPGRGFAQKALEAAEKSKVRSLLDMLASSTTPAPSSLTLREIQAEIRGDDVILLEYALGTERSYLWVISQAGMRSYEISLSTKVLSQVEKRLRASVRAPGMHLRETVEQERTRNEQAYATYRRERERLAAALLGPVSPSLKQKTLIIVPDGFLHYVSFVTLLPEQNRDLVILPSASALKALRKATKKRPPPNADVVIVVDPVFEPDDERLARASASSQRPHPSSEAYRVARGISGSSNIERLWESRKEGQAIVTIFNKEKVVLIQDFEASREIAFRVLPHYRIIHFGTHGFLDTQRPERSGLVLSMFDKDGHQINGYLRLRDIYHLKLSADLVVLSACESALGKDLQSEGMIGLTRAFLYAGSKRVISTLWKVDDLATRELMTHFYQRLHGGESPSQALRGAQADLAASPKWNYPYYWAAFVLQGEYRWARKP